MQIRYCFPIPCPMFSKQPPPTDSALARECSGWSGDVAWMVLQIVQIENRQPHNGPFSCVCFDGDVEGEESLICATNGMSSFIKISSQQALHY